MMFPLHDRLPTRIVPYVNYSLLAVNTLLFLILWLGGPETRELTYELAMVPANYSDGVGASDLADLVTSTFMHAGILHLVSNMFFLWIFGDNVEERMGHAAFLAFYLGGGVVANLAHLLTNLGSQIPTVGASGSVAAVMGAYLVLFPEGRVVAIVSKLTIMGRRGSEVKEVPARDVLFYWFFIEMFRGVLSLGGADVGGVAYWAHVGGFVAGVLLAFKLSPSGTVQSVVPQVVSRSAKEFLAGVRAARTSERADSHSAETFTRE